jgi:hypothetical protein
MEILVPKFYSYLLFIDQNNSRRITPYQRGPPAAYLAHINELNSRKMVEEVKFIILCP